jgi:uncharacterized protein YbjT (DUF2867 family)
MRVLVTGATGKLGSALVPLLTARHTVRGLSRKPLASTGDIEWVRGDLRSGAGIDEAVSGMDVIVHAATHGGLSADKIRVRYTLWHPGHTDVDGTRMLATAAQKHGVKHLLYTSVVGVDRVPFGYWRSKLRAEEIISSGGVPFTHVRITQFHELVDAAIRYALRFPLALLTREQRVQPIDPSDAARSTAPLVDEPPRQGIVEFGGPEAMTYGDAADAWLVDRGKTKRIHSLPMPGRLGKALASGALCTEDRSGTITWSEWLRMHPLEER